ncbi:tetratricopeptide repeat protein [Terriglobus sp.]|uniref:tetratricopeptide repeat protein n=1 Tax=Terriglobus sp. TaxID=1889013 RepID=UPI003B0054CF
MNRLLRASIGLWSLLFAANMTASAQGLAAARSLAHQGKIDAAIAEAQKVTSATPQSADAQELLCKLHGSIDQFDEAIAACEAAHSAQPGNAAYTLELARAYGAKADHAGPFTGMRMVGRIRDNFEGAARQDPKNVDALSDLGEFYVNAPGVVGGGLDHARQLVSQLKPLSPARAARLEGMIAAKAGDTTAADAAYGRELAVQHSAEAYVDLANYDRKRKLWDQAEQNAVLAIQQDGARGPDSIDAARVLIDMKRNSAAAEKALRGYLAHEQVSAVAQYARAHVMLGQLLQQRGDNAGAEDQFKQALALAGDYSAARKALRK